MHAVAGEQRVLAGRYLLSSRIGRGAMGTVWRARDPVLARDVAVKEIQVPSLLTRHEREVLHQRTLREARAAARLNHPGVVTVFDVIEAEGNPWIVMELVQARSLEQVLAQDGPLPPGQAASAGAMVLAALSCAHAAGIMHRDVKPSNVLLSGDGRAVLTDFGIATLEGDPGLTQAGMVMGTPGFSAPERVRGEAATPASDLWSLGATLYAAVEGHGPFADRGAPMAVLAAVAGEDAPPARHSGPLGPVISALLQRDPGQRPDAATTQRLLAAAAATGNDAATGARESKLPANPPLTARRTSAPASGYGPAAAHPAPAPTVPPARPAATPLPTSSRDAAPARPARHAGPAGRVSGHHARAGAGGRGLSGPGLLRWRMLAAVAALVTGAGLLIGLLAGR
jgi:serine/threonine protein kinase